MDDLGQAKNLHQEVYMLGGGNPGSIPEMERHFREELELLLSEDDTFEQLVGHYDSPQGNTHFLKALAELLKSEFEWPISEQNIAITNGSQSSFGILFSLFAGAYSDGSEKQILLPMTPEYIGYTDTGPGTGKTFQSNMPVITDVSEDGNRFFKYSVDFDSVNTGENCGAICVSRPTNPTGNVITDAELENLRVISRESGIPLIIDGAYGLPFPGIIFTPALPLWDNNIILCLSLSKLGLAGVRTGIVIADVPVIEKLKSSNAVFNLAPGGFGPALVTRLIREKQLLGLCDKVVRPFYRSKKDYALEIVYSEMNHLPVRIHKPEGAMFLWIWFEGLPISCEELYQNLKSRNVYVIAGHHFFPGLEEQNWKHKHECIRVSYAGHPETVRQGIKLIADEATKAYHQL